ncbi:hypothetical protein M9Y10_028462 [Tritrichomonas musculus]|uniref:Uncharacterized protein n=1 Tax=Tritrichomonas musculus TaxID=1915356 RepID=A0ABR2KJE9_9EUKA
MLEDKYKKIIQSEYTNDSFTQELQESTAKLIGSTSISALITCSEQFREFICAISKISMDLTYYYQLSVQFFQKRYS